MKPEEEGNRKTALIWALVWVGVVAGITFISYVNHLRFGIGETVFSDALSLAILVFLLSYLSYRRGKL